MPQIDWPVRSIPCATLALVTNSDHFYVRKTDRQFLPIGADATYVRRVGSTDTRSPVTIDLGSSAGDYRLRNANGAIIDPVAASFTLEMDAGVIVNYPTRPILTSPGMIANETYTNPTRVTAYDAGFGIYTGSVILQVTRNDNAGIVEAFIDQLYDPRNWFELPLPGDHLGTASVTGYSAGNIVINTTGEDNYHGWWVRVGNRTGRITSHSVATTLNNEGNFAYAHTIRITPPSLITGTTATDSANNFVNRPTLRCRATSVTATGDPEFAGSWLVEFTETDGAQ